MRIETKFSLQNHQSAIEQYLSMIYPSKECYIALCLIPKDNLSVEHRFTTVSQIQKYLSYCRFRNASGWNIYITPSVLKPGAHSRRKESFLPHQKVIYVDCDQPSCLLEVKGRYPYPTLVVRTSKGRYQIYWRLSESVAVTDQEALMRRLARDLGGDIAATDVSRVLRLPSFWNRKPNRNNTVDIVFIRDNAVSYQSLCRVITSEDTSLSPLQQTSSSTQQRQRVLESSGDGRVLPEKKLSESERDWYLIHRWLALGVSPDECIARIISRRQGQKRQVDYYARYSVEKAVRRRMSEKECLHDDLQLGR